MARYEIKMLCSILLLSFLILFSESAIASDVQDSDHTPPRSARKEPDCGGVKLDIRKKYVTMDNEILRITLTNPGGDIFGIHYNDRRYNLLQVANKTSFGRKHMTAFNGGYWDIVWNGDGVTRRKGEIESVEGTCMKVVSQNEEKVELSFKREWDLSMTGELAPVNVDKRYVMLKGSSGFYTYAIYEHLKEWPPFEIDNIRLAFRLNKDKFHYMAIADNRKRLMPRPQDRFPDRGQVLDYPEAVRLVNPIDPQFQGEVDDKYQYSCESKNNQVHGWISNNPHAGFWQIIPNNEFRSGGPTKQLLTSHVGPATLSVFHSTHYAGKDMVMRFGPNEPWKKVFGPIFIYLNSLSEGDKNPISLWKDAKQQMMHEVQSWPYDFLASKDFPSSNQRGKVSGRLLVLDRQSSDSNLRGYGGSKPGNGAYVGLAPPGDAGSWQLESKGYQFWAKSNEDGQFKINGIRAGDYNLYAWVPGFIGDYHYKAIITIRIGDCTDLGDLVYEPPRNGSTVWEIGIPDRSAAEFFIPDPNPNYTNKLYLHQEKFRQYGLWERYTDLFPDGDLIYRVGADDYTKNWFFAQVPRKMGNNTYQRTTWQIKFNLDEVQKNGTYFLRLALATAHVSRLNVWVNDPTTTYPQFTTGVIGKDNTIARHGIHGIYRLYSVGISGDQLLEGENTIFLSQGRRILSPFQGFMYDYIRLESPS